MTYKRFLFFLCFCALFFGVHAQKSFFSVEKDDCTMLRVRFDVGALLMEQVKVDGASFTSLSIDGYMPSAEAGAPSLPTFSGLIEVPLCDAFDVEVSGEVYDTLVLKGGRVMPLQPSRSKSDRGSHALVLDERIYSADHFYGVSTAIVEPAGIARDRRLARLQFSPVRYNPVRGELLVCRQAVVTVRYLGSNEEGTRAMYNRYHSPAFNSGAMSLNSLYSNISGQTSKSSATAPVRYLIVAHSSFRNQLDGFVQWKRRKGFLTDIVYTDDAGVGTTSTAIAAYVKSQYDNATASSPAPTYLLIVGDHEQIPAFSAQVTSPSSDHITDLYFATWTSGDILPDCYYGRFSAQTLAQLTPQIQKTLMYEQYTFADPSFLDRAVMVAGVDGGSSGDYGYTHADPAMDYAITNYVNGANGFSQVMYFKNDQTIVPSGSNVTMGSSASSNSATVRNCYNQGAGWINYSAHGSATSWGTPNFTTTHAAAMTNSQKFGIMIGNCCLTNKFETATCLGESVLRKDNYCGAVGYIGGSNSTYWNEDFYWAVGLRSGIGPSMSMAYNSSNLGGYDRIFHTHGEAYSQWVETQGELMMMGNMAVQSSTSSLKNYYWEIYHLMGDPSLMPYHTQAQTMTLTASPVVMLGAATLTVSAAPYAYVALTDTLTRTLWASGYTNANGQVTLTLPSGMTVGAYELAASAQQYRTAFSIVSVVPSSGPYPVVVSVTPASQLIAGTTVPLTVKVANLGNSNASGVSVALTSDNTLVTVSSGTVSVGSIAAGDTVTLTNITVTASAQAADAAHATLTASTQWTGGTSPTTCGFPLTVNAPAVTMTVTQSSTSVLPGGDVTVSVNLVNNGHATLTTSQLTLTAGNPQMTVTSSGGSFTLAQGGTITRQFQLHAAATIDSNIFVPLYLHLGGGVTMNDTLQLYIGVNSTETFEGGQYQVQGWTQGSYPWTFTSDEAYEGSWSARSAADLGNSNTSAMSITFNVTSPDSVSFYFKVSSEANYDWFRCYLDGAEMIAASGEYGWTHEAFAVAAGSHQLTFSYEKDVSVNSGSDCAWIDNISLPHGVQTGDGGGGGGDDGEEGTFTSLNATFEESANDGIWTLVNGNLTNAWTIGSAGANGTGRGLYISNDGGATNAYTISASASVFAYTTIWLDQGDYVSSFDWRCNGESSFDYLRVALLPDAMSIAGSASLPSGWSTTALPSGAIALDGGSKLNQSSSWQTKTSDVHVSQAGWYKLVFFWRNDQSVGTMPPAAIDNVMLLPAGGIHTITVTADHGVTTGSGSYQTGEVVTIGVYPEAGYSFVGWNDAGQTLANSNNPRQIVVEEDITITAVLSQSNIITMHDTVVVQDTANVIVYDTVTTMQTVHDTVTTTQTVYDTMSVTLYDTVTMTQTVFDTMAVTLYDTVTMTQTVFDTMAVTLYDTVTTTNYVYDTMALTVYDTVTTTNYVYDTMALTVYDTVTTTNYVYDTMALTVYDTVTTVQTLFDTITTTQVVFDTTAITLFDTVTTVQTLFDTITTTQVVFDTTAITLFDTVTTVQTLFDTVTTTQIIYDTSVVVVMQYDTVTTTQTLYDTTLVTLFDTVTTTQILYDTTIVTLFDTTTVQLFDTTSVTVFDTTTVMLFDTTSVTVFDTIVSETVDTVYISDTTVLFDTIYFFDTIYLFDTIFVHDTIFIHDNGVDPTEPMNVKIYARNGQLLVEGAGDNAVSLYDVIGRLLATKQDNIDVMLFDIPATGSYFVKIGDAPARKVVVVR